MKDIKFCISENKKIARDVFLMRLMGDTGDISSPGQFVNIKIGGLYLRRPISVCCATDGELTIIYKVVGRGTDAMSKMTAGESLNVLTGLGNGYDASLSGNKPLLVGGGVGVPPLYGLAKKLTAENKNVTAVLGFQQKDDIFGEKEFRQLGVKTYITTNDGSYGIKGFVTDVMKGLHYTYFYACGPESMLRAVCGVSETSGELSFERRMGCGFGACMGCSCMTLTGSKRICKDGPVLKKEEILWEN
ncbi:MAG: dihydroorotate dehydrogenase electron transfer subunit [Synergistes sp.]|nr:dihydroorotate dehydrogenase electron transfer subunit [Synergistes sp.]